mmetsp:Transcript_22335/g.52552  ORF Transcript_22335/g.52552 Transcript_22335/m.52552 type:complete len:554 (+) Transcript_22335:182-1843(+)
MSQTSEMPKNVSKLPDHEYSASKMTKEELEQLLCQFEEAIETIEVEEKKAYLKAKKQAPHILNSESPSLQFIRHANGDLWAAAQRLCTYWKYRTEVFQGRALLPLNLTGRGALTKSDILCLQGGYPAILPNAKDGKQVIFVDRRMLTSRTTNESKLRCLFYVAFVLAKDERAQAEGIWCLYVLMMPRIQGFDRQWLEFGWKVTRYSFPIKPNILGICLLPKTGNQSFQGILSSYMTAIVQGGFPTNRASLHIEQEESKIRDALLASGLTIEGIPTSLCGEYRMVSTSQWVLDRAREEKAMIAKHQKSQSTVKPNMEGTITKPCATGKRARTDEERRTANAIHSRRKRERRQLELQAIRQEHDKSARENESLKVEQARLERLLNQAKALLTELSRSHGFEYSNNHSDALPDSTSADDTKTANRATASSVPLTHLLPCRGTELVPERDGNHEQQQQDDYDKNDELENLMESSIISSQASIVSSSLLDEISMDVPSALTEPNHQAAVTHTPHVDVNELSSATRMLAEQQAQLEWQINNLSNPQFQSFGPTAWYSDA